MLPFIWSKKLTRPVIDETGRVFIYFCLPDWNLSNTLLIVVFIPFGFGKHIAPIIMRQFIQCFENNFIFGVGDRYFNITTQISKPFLAYAAGSQNFQIIVFVIS